MNCEKHGRLIIAVIDVDTEDEKKYCIGCIEHLEAVYDILKGDFKKLSQSLEELNEALKKSKKEIEELTLELCDANENRD